MKSQPAAMPVHPRFSRRNVIQAGAISLLGLGVNHVTALQAMSAPGKRPSAARSVIYIFLSGGLGQLDSFDMKPDAPDMIRGEFKPIQTKTTGIQICEHLPLLAERSNLWSLCRSMNHGYSEHSQGHMAMLSGRTMMPPGFSPSASKPSDWPSIAAIANTVAAPRNNLPPAVVLPEKLVHRTGRVIPGQFAGEMGSARDPMFIEACKFQSELYGAYPTYAFHHARDKEKYDDFVFQAPNLALPEGVETSRFQQRLDLLKLIKTQQVGLEQMAESQEFDRHRTKAVSLLSDRKTQQAFDVHSADDKTQDRYGRNSFGWSLLLARQLVEAGVNLVQVNLGNNETWDLHGNAFPHLKNYLFPPADQAISALLDDLQDRGMLGSTLIVMAGEMGRTPRLSTLGKFYKTAGRDHWPTQTVFFAGGGTKGGNVVGTTDKIGGFPAANPQKPENMAATIYEALGLPRTTSWHDHTGRPHFIYHGDPIPGLT